MKSSLLVLVVLLSISLVTAMDAPYTRWDFENGIADTGTQGWNGGTASITSFSENAKVGSYSAYTVGENNHFRYYDANIPTDQDFYMGCWFYLEDTNSNDFEMCFGQPDTYPALCMASAFSFDKRLVFSDAGYGDYDTGINTVYGQWVHYGMGRDASEGIGFITINGTTVYQNTYTAPQNPYDIFVGSSINYGETPTGYVDNCYYLPRIPTPTEMEEILQTETPCVTPTPGMDITEDTVFCPGTYNMTEGGISISADNIDVSCDQTVFTGWHDDQENGLNLFNMNDRTNVQLHGCDIYTVRNAINMNNGVNIEVYDIEFHDIGVDVIGGQNLQGVSIHDITGESAQNANIFIAGDDITIYNVEGVQFIYLGYWAEGEGYAIASNVSVFSTYPDHISIHGTDFSIHNNEAYRLEVVSNEVDIQNSEVYGNTFDLIQDYADYNTEDITWCVSEVGNTRLEYQGDHPEDGSCEALCTPEWECSGYSDVCIMFKADCDEATDINECGIEYTGDYSEFERGVCGTTSDSTGAAHQQVISPAQTTETGQKGTAFSIFGGEEFNLWAWIDSIIFKIRGFFGLGGSQ